MLTNCTTVWLVCWATNDMQCLHVHRVDRTSHLQEWPWSVDADMHCGNQHRTDHTAESAETHSLLHTIIILTAIFPCKPMLVNYHSFSSTTHSSTQLLRVKYYYYNRFTTLWILSGTTRVSRYQKKNSSIVVINHPLPASSIYYDPRHTPVQFTCLTVFFHNCSPNINNHTSTAQTKSCNKTAWRHGF